MPKFLVIEGPLKDKIIEFRNGTVFCGRHPNMNDISILDITVSRKHLKIFNIGEYIFIEDLKSKHGTMVNGKVIEPGEGFQVNKGDLIKIGNTVMRLTEVSVKKPLVKNISKNQKTKRESVTEGPSNQERRSTKELELIYNISELFKRKMDIHKFLEKVLTLLVDALPRIDNAGFFLFRNEKIQIMEIVTKSSEKSVTQYSRRILDRVIRDRKTIRMSNTAFESSDDYADSEDSLKIRSVMCVPIISGSEILGAIYMDSGEPYAFRKSDQMLILSLTGPMAVVIEKEWLSSHSHPDQAI